MKKTPIAIASSLLAVSIALFTSCGETATGFSSNWYKNTALSSNISGTEETLTYKIDYDSSEKTNTNYEIAYDGGVYTTRLVDSTYQWSDGTTENVYVYSTQMNINVTYTIAGETHTYADSVVSSVTFRTSDRELEPIESSKTVVSHTPVATSPNTFEEGVVAYNYTFETKYSKDLSGATLTYTDDESGESEESSFTLNDKYSYIDNEELLFAIRGMSLNDGESETVQCLNASRKIVQTITVSNASVSALTPTFTVDGTLPTEDITYNQVTIGINGTQSGSSQTCYLAATTSMLNNAYRNVMIYMKNTLPYGLGSLNYTLVEAVFANK